MRIRGQNDLSVAILGLGAVGGFLAGLFLRKGFAVTCIVKEQNAGLFIQEGIRIQSSTFGDFTVHPRIVTYLDRKVDILLVTVKSIDLDNAIKRIDPGYVKDALIIPLLNGLEHMQVIRLAFNGLVIAATIGRVELKRMELNHIVHSTHSAHIDLAYKGDIEKNVLTEIAELFSGIGITAKVLNSEADVFWQKLVRLNAIACTTSATNKPVGFVRSDREWRKRLKGCVDEAARVAQAEGVNIDSDAVMDQIDNLPEGLGTSMQRDIAAGKPSELDSIAGAVIRAGARHGIVCSAIEALLNELNTNK